MDVDHDGSLVPPRVRGGIIGEACARVVSAVLELPIADALSLDREYDTVGRIIFLRDEIGSADELIADSRRVIASGAGYIEVVEVLESAYSIFPVNSGQPQVVLSDVLALLIGKAGRVFRLLSRMAELELKARTCLIALSCRVILVGILVILSVMDDARRVAVPRVGGIYAEGVALTAAFLLGSGIDELVVLGRLRFL